MTHSDQHPAKDQLLKFALGKLEAESIEEISEHLQQCEECTQYLEQDFRDTLVDKLSDISSSSEEDFLLNVPESPEVSFERLKQLLHEKTKYQLERVIGSGGMGTVYLANHSVMGRQVAIKVVKDRIFADEKAIKRFEIETKSAAQLAHPNIVTAYDADQIDGVHFLVMEYVDGESLAEVLKRKGPLSVRRACNYIYQVCAGLRHAHSLGMVHRDIKPQNLMRTSKGRIKILDFGLARIHASEMPDQNLTQSGVMMGTANYVAPEQARDGRNADIRSDLYSVGCTLYALLSGRVPFPKGTYMEKVLAHCTKPFPSIQKLRNDIPDTVNEILLKLTAKNPDDRFQNPKEVQDALEEIVRGDPSTDELAAKTVTNQEENKAAGESPAQISSTTTDPNDSEDNSKDQLLALKDRSTPSSTGASSHLVRTTWLFTFFLFTGILLFWVGYLNGSFKKIGWFTSQPIVDIVPDDKPSVPGKKTILVFLSPEKFWFGDFGPLETAMNAKGISIETVSVQEGEAQFDPTDTTNEKRNLTIDHTIEDFSKIGSLDRYSAIVFIGNSVREFVRSGETSEAMQKILDRSKGKRWIVGIGRGMSIPLFYRTYDGSKICYSRWINSRFTDGRTPDYVREAVVVDKQNLCLTGTDWHQSEELSKQLADLLTE